MNKCLLNGIGIVLVAMVVSSCGPKAGVDIDHTVSNARQMALDGNVDQALALLEPFYKSSRYKFARPAILAAQLQIEVAADRMAAAQQRFLKVAVKSPEVAAQVTGVIENALLSRSQYQELMDWCITLCAYKLGDVTLTATAQKHVMALSSLGRTGELAQTIGTYLPLLSEPAALSLFSGYFTTSVKDQNWALSESLLAVIDKMVKESPGKRAATVGFSIQLLLAKDGWKAADTYFRGVMNELPDSGAAHNLRVVGDAAVATNQLAAAEALYEFGLVDDSSRPRLREAASVGWVNVANRRGDTMEMIRRLKVLETKKIPVDGLISLISMNYSGLISRGTRESFDVLNQFCETLRGGTQVEMNLRQLDGFLLDISYFREDYDGSLKIVERGLIMTDPLQKAMMINKINAHIALKKSDYRGAIAYFRKFMDVIAKENSYTVDPIDQIRVSPAMILGLNARRIGDLWIKEGSAEEATKAYQEARQYYADALKEFPESASSENKKILREMKEIPQG